MSTKTQPGRRTPLSLSGVVTKSASKSGSNAASSSGNNANGHTTSNTNKQDNKLQQKIETQIINNADTKENPNKKQQPHADKKQQQIDNKKSNDKNENGVNNNKQQQQFNENKQHQQNKDQQQPQSKYKQQQQQNKDKQQQNGNGDNKVNDKDNKEKTEKPDKLEKEHDISEKADIKLNEEKNVDQEKLDNKKEEKKTKEIKDSNEDKKEGVSKSDTKTEHQQQLKNDDKNLKEGNQVKNEKNDKKSEEKAENKDVVEEQQQSPQKSSTPGTPKSNSNANKTLTPVNKTTTKLGQKTPQKSVPINSAKATKREMTTTIDDNDIEMEPLAIESSPIKLNQRDEVANVNISPSATSTPGKILLQKLIPGSPKSDVKLAMQTGISPERPRAFSQISGRRSIRPISDFTPSKLQSNLQYRESYRRINTELDVTNTSMNVTVGSEVPSNLSFSFFGRGRKRDHTPPQNSQSAIGDLQADMEISPPKKARLDMHGFFSAVSSPISLLRNRFSKTSLKSSTPVKLQQKLNTAEDEIEVQNVSGVSVHDEISKSDHDDNDAALREDAKENKLKTNIDKAASIEADSEGKEFTDVSLKSEKSCGIEQACEASDIKITETLLQNAVGDPLAKNKRCIVM